MRMRKYDLSKIMKRAWVLVKRSDFSISEALKKAWKEEKGMEVENLVKRYSVSFCGDDKIRVENIALLKKDNAEDIIKNRKPEIMAFLKEKEESDKAAYEARQKKINSIEGLAEIRDAIFRMSEWRESFEREWASGSGFVGLSLKKKPEVNVDGLKKRYPRAAAYLIAESESLKSNYELSAIGKEALESIINGEDHEKVLKKMKDDQKAFSDRHMWD